MPASAADVVSPAFKHTRQQLFKPFRFGQWVRLAIIGLLAGELGSAGGCGVQLPWRPRSDGSQSLLAQAAIPRGPLFILGVSALILLGIILLVALIYISSRMRFVLFDSVVAKECRIRRFWAERRSQGLNYFLFQLLFTVAMFIGIGSLLAIASLIVFGFGWARNPREHLVPLILGGLIFAIVVAAFLITALVIAVLTKDFVVPQMALENIGVVEGWRRLLERIEAEKAGYAGYVGMKILLSIAASIATGIAAAVVVLVLLIPIALLCVTVILLAAMIGLTWNAFTISLAVAGAVVLLPFFLFGILLASVPMVVFFPAYSIYFFAPRYEPLRMALTR